MIHMPLVAAAVCPHPPLLVPELAAGAAAELDDLRTACVTAVDRLVGAADRVVVVGGGPRTANHHGRGSFARYGVPRTVLLSGQDQPDGPSTAEPPLSLLVGFWLLQQAAPGPDGGGPAVRGQAVAADAAPQACAALGRDLAAVPARVGLLVMGDGSACRGVRSPGYDDPRAEPFDAAVAGALARADVPALLSLDPALARQLQAAGRAPWQVLAGAAQATGGPWRGTVTYQAAPYGVAYLVACWEPA
ncbi:MAG TPA: class III extradiol dioxygenase subunit B-like domain-containing protein [Micromonosporaceae bacterium]|nr:class III extradiol dioxygenase subunit B-like domain-containing protein [Micromonosporaceae bacterium]